MCFVSFDLYAAPMERNNEGRLEAINILLLRSKEPQMTEQDFSGKASISRTSQSSIHFSSASPTYRTLLPGVNRPQNSLITLLISTFCPPGERVNLCPSGSATGIRFISRSCAYFRCSVSMFMRCARKQRSNSSVPKH